MNTGRTHFKKGMTPWNKGIKRLDMTGRNHFAWKGGKQKRNCLFCSKEFYIEHDRIKDKSRGKFCSRSCVGKYHKGELGFNWRGGIYITNLQIRSSSPYKAWRIAVFKRDNWKCVICGTKGIIEADHIKPFSLFKELRLDINNGRTLCATCHKSTTSYGKKIFKNYKQFFNESKVG